MNTWPFSYILSMSTLTLWQQSWIVVKNIIWSSKPEIFIFGIYKKKFANACSECSDLLITLSVEKQGKGWEACREAGALPSYSTSSLLLLLNPLGLTIKPVSNQRGGWVSLQNTGLTDNTWGLVYSFFLVKNFLLRPQIFSFLWSILGTYTKRHLS